MRTVRDAALWTWSQVPGVSEELENTSSSPAVVLCWPFREHPENPRPEYLPASHSARFPLAKKILRTLGNNTPPSCQALAAAHAHSHPTTVRTACPSHQRKDLRQSKVCWAGTWPGGDLKRVRWENKVDPPTNRPGRVTAPKHGRVPGLLPASPREGEQSCAACPPPPACPPLSAPRPPPPTCMVLMQRLRWMTNWLRAAERL